jgi:hypothetical protein
VTICENLKRQLVHIYYVKYLQLCVQDFNVYDVFFGIFLQTLLSPNDITPRTSASSVTSGAPQGSAKHTNITLLHESTANNPLQNDRELIRRQEMVMKQQDLALNDIERGVGRLRNQVNN